ncbi:DUF3048 domain-containing protein [Desertihabitans aurantiacus]|uniref:DUF3048 domain-containing protein n=1 Tax=Desertihabitans aurantiacus TaxID=2282477 RepID=UPI000DF7F86A|nr:DUF3048 domain-containing protein [Desertihabitans aurantiacus]
MRSQNLRRWLVAGAVALVVVAVVVVGVVLGQDRLGSGEVASTPPPTTAAAPTPSPTPTPTPTPTPSADPVDHLTGGEPDDGEVFAVKIDNVAAARPQVGLGSADIVVVEEVEASLTRLVAIFHTEFPERVGPVRSARNTDVELLPMLGEPGLVYSGANRLVQENVRGSEHLTPIERSDRDSSRPAPHNVVVDLGQIADDQEVGTAQDIGWRFGDRDAVWDDAEEYSDLEAEVGQDEYTFTRRDERYQPAVNGDPYVDADSGEAVLADNVVRLEVENRKDTQSTDSKSIVSETTGTGRAWFSREGKTIRGTWQRDGITEPMTFTDEDGEPVLLRPGRTWVLLQG